jgi:23S rRNA pseudoU1915 N3-methylase RlmH
MPSKRRFAMYTRLTRFPLKPNSNDRATEIVQKYEKVLHDLPGHESTVIFLDEENLTSVTTWGSEEQAQAVKGTRDAAQRDMADILAGDPSTTVAPTLVHDVR